jgi:hypothetical protein
MRDEINSRCKCPRCTIRSLRGPAVLITLGILFLLDQMHGDFLTFRHTWPVILLVLGAMSLACSVAPMDGHVEPVNANPPPPMPPPIAPPGPFPGQRP